MHQDVQNYPGSKPLPGMEKSRHFEQGEESQACSTVLWLSVLNFNCLPVRERVRVFRESPSLAAKYFHGTYALKHGLFLFAAIEMLFESG